MSLDWTNRPYYMTWSGRLAFLLPSSLSLGRGETAAGGGYAVDMWTGFSLGSRPHDSQERSKESIDRRAMHSCALGCAY